MTSLKSAPQTSKRTGLTQFGRACQELGIESVCANTPQAKGRVERVNKTLQDRLVKEMRLANIDSIKQANAWLPSFIETYNKKFAVTPQSDTNAHRKDIPTANILELILSLKYQRKLSKQLELSDQNVIYQIQTKTTAYAMRKAYVTVCDNQGHITILYKGKALQDKTFDKHNAPSKVIDNKQINSLIDNKIKTQKSADNHPWRKSYKVA